MKSLPFVVLALSLGLAGCGEAEKPAAKKAPVDRALLFDFPDDADAAFAAAAKIRAQAEEAGGACAEAGYTLYEAARQHRTDENLTDIALANADPMEVDVSDPAWTEASSESYGQMLDAVSAAQDACKPR